LTNVGLAARGGNVVITVSALLSIQVMLGVAMWASATWPLLFDPSGDGDAPTALLRKGAMMVARRPWRFVAVVALEALFTLAQVTVLALAFLLPSVMVLFAGYVVVPRIDVGGVVPDAGD
jgi:hypothetical protein